MLNNIATFNKPISAEGLLRDVKRAVVIQCRQAGHDAMGGSI